MSALPADHDPTRAWRLDASLCGDSDLRRWQTDCRHLLALLTAEQRVDGTDHADSIQLVQWQLDAINAEQERRRRLRLVKPDTECGIPPELIEAVKARLSLPALIRDRGIALVKMGRTWRGPCPFHQGDNRSAFTVWDDNHFRCWSCGASGDAIAFVMAHDGLPFDQAMAGLAAIAGVTLPEAQ